MGKGQRARKAAADAMLASAMTQSKPSVLEQEFHAPSSLQVVAPKAQSGLNVVMPAVHKKPSPPPSETSASSAVDNDEFRELASEEQREALKALEDPEAAKTQLSSVLSRLVAAFSSKGERHAAAADIVAAVEVLGVASPVSIHLLDEIKKFLVAKPTTAREGALLAIVALLKSEELSSVMEPVVVEQLTTIMQRHADSEHVVKNVAATLAKMIAQKANPLAIHSVLKQIYKGLELRQWQSKVAALNLLKELSETASEEVSGWLPEIMPIVTEYVWDTKKQVQAASIEALIAVCSKINNDDVVPLVPTLVGVIARPEETMKAIDSLLATTFVANVDAPTLSLIAPLLHKALRDTSIHSSSLKRKASKIIDSMCRLVVRPSDVMQFVPLLLPQLETAIDRLIDEEVVASAKEARAHLVHAAGDGEAMEADPIEIRNKLESDILTAFTDTLDRPTHPGLNDFTLAYVSDVCAELATQNRGSEWRDGVMAYLQPHMHHKDAEHICEALRAAGGGLGEEREKSTDPNDVCDLDFSLAYGGKILLRNARLRLTRGHRYGLIGQNGVGKTTLMRNLATGAIEGLPETLRSVYVQHEDIVESQGSLLESMCKAPELAHQTTETVEKTLTDIGFTQKMLDGEIDALSGGWRMKLALARAMLYNADVLLLDEPTNHLDVHAVQWLVDYLNSLETMTVLLVSHDTGFLDNVCTDIFHYESKKLVLYPMTLSEFVAIHPEAKHYYELKSSDMVFNLPEPGRLEGINSMTRRILTLDNATYTYPGASKPQLSDVSVKLCLASRVAVIGVNGAGKSTLIKMLVQETSPDTGTFWKHHAVRLAYVAQHSFHHVEKHLDSSPVEYFQWRFGGENGIDRELSDHVNLQQTEEEKNLVGKKHGQVEKIVSRTKGKRGTLEYECKLVGMTERHNKRYTLEQLQEMGLGALAEAEDIRQATLAGGLDLRPLTTKEIQRHLDDFALPAEFGTHGKIRGLSGGQKVKLVIAAAMWNRPHLLVLDEPTNYLDRAALGALADGIRQYAGGVIMISHSEEFYNSLCTEKWLVESGRLTIIGEAQEKEYRAGGGRKVVEEEPEEEKKVGSNINSNMKRTKLTNPKTMRPLSKQQIRKLSKLCKAAGVSFDDYVDGITRESSDWKWL
ncbi:Elongation factor 3 [Phytophthora fragariae]|uniref:Elongation factor 3 n=2 Tax=Phytophthora fragariae TaxID=53985 RepID=A0A6A3SGS2_9STRA|nr:Elongation factor 3 [Phytophthora fragariae]KAE8996216.1 Elongation factor 3 [Phytophthora fragariae]KAE9095770.1 Elongation factor 3 [Phytophthora fragariae]KAE9116774.1 Elongation factor 3 [Phytophthora fragariae]KAE9146974.1 Elongation factor 3 [Phytophthora fragariae]